MAVTRATRWPGPGAGWPAAELPSLGPRPRHTRGCCSRSTAPSVRSAIRRCAGHRPLRQFSSSLANARCRYAPCRNDRSAVRSAGRGELTLPVVACRPNDVAGVVVADAARLKGHQLFSSLRFTHWANAPSHESPSRSNRRGPPDQPPGGQTGNHQERSGNEQQADRWLQLVEPGHHLGRLEQLGAVGVGRPPESAQRRWTRRWCRTAGRTPLSWFGATDQKPRAAARAPALMWDAEHFQQRGAAGRGGCGSGIWCFRCERCPNCG